MKKRLLLGLLAVCSAVNSFALTNGEFVYTPQGRFQIKGDNLNANNAFVDFTGWTLVTDAESKELKDQFNMNTDGCAPGLNSMVSLDATATEGMYFRFAPVDPSATYIVSFKMKGSFAETTRIKTTAISTDLVLVQGNSEGVYGSEADAIICNTAEELKEEWQTFNYAIGGDGIGRVYFISFTGMSTDIEIADLQIAEAVKYADLRQRDEMVKKLKVYKDCYAWPAELIAEYELDAIIANLEAIGDNSSQAELEDQLTTAEETLQAFLEENMDDFLAGGPKTSTENDNTLGIRTASGNLQKVSELGNWTATTTGRTFWSNNAYPDLGHYQNGYKWNNSVDSPMGIYMQKELIRGSYVFSIESWAAFRENLKQTWDYDDGMRPAYGIAYIAKVVDGVVQDPLVSVELELGPTFETRAKFLLSTVIEEEGTYEIAFKGWCKDAYKDLARGNALYLANAAVWGKLDSPYRLNQLNYEADVREQITTGRNNLTTATEYIANADYSWGKAELQASIDEVEPLIAGYEAYTQEQIIETFEAELYDKDQSLKEPDYGLLVYEVYDKATKLIIAANRDFLLKNDTLNSIQTVISTAEQTLGLRIYDACTGKAALQAAIDKAKGIQAQMKASEYSVENAAAIVAANAELNEAIAAFKASLPASAVTNIVDIDFENDAVMDLFGTGTYHIDGAKGSMDFSGFSTQTVADNYDFEKGFWSNGEQLWKGYLRVGNGTGTTLFDPTSGTNTMGTNILRISFDLYCNGLSSKYMGFSVKDEQDNDIAVEYIRVYDSGFETDKNTFDIDINNIARVSGSNYGNVSPADAENPSENYTIPKTSFDLIFDYGAGVMYCTTTTASNTATTAAVALPEAIPAKFILTSNYNSNQERRGWFDNLKIDRITAGAYDGIETVKTDAKLAGDNIYTLGGVRVANPTQKGIYIKNGKKFVVK